MLTADFAAVQHRGCALSYTVRGEGPPVLMIQGVGVHGSGWGPQVEALSARYRCLSFDNRGLGLSQPRGAAISVDQMAEDALALMDAQEWDSAHIVGHSLGGLIAQHLALSARSRVRSLSLLCTFSRGRDALRFSPWIAWVALRTQLGPRRLRRYAFLQLVMPLEALAQADRDTLADRLALIFGHDLAVQAPVVLRQMAAMTTYDATPRLHELAGLPTLIVSAAQDRLAPPVFGRAIAAAIPGSVYVEIPGASHGVTIQHAGRINTLLEKHFTDSAVLQEKI